MLRNLSWETTDNLVRSQLRIYCELGDAMRISEQDRCRVLLLEQQEWNDWAGFMNDGALPPAPPLPEMLQRLGRASYRLAVLSEHREAAARA